MGNFRVFSLKVQVLCLIFIISPSPIKGSGVNTIKGTLPNLSTVFQLMESFIGPIIRSIGDTSISSGSTFRAPTESAVEKVIKEKIAELKLYFQDDDEDLTKDEEDSNNLTLEGNDETTIIEFVRKDQSTNKNKRNRDAKPKADLSPKEKIQTEETRNIELQLKDKIQKYKKLRQNINKALKNEHVSRDTRSLVTNTLDEMTARMIENKCSWSKKRSDNIMKTKTRVDKTISIANEWSKQWGKLKEQYLRQANKYSPNDPAAKIYLLFEQLHEFVSHILKDMYELTQYKVSCEFSRPGDDNDKKIFEFNTDNNDKNALRKGNKTAVIKKKSKCKNFKVCSDELAKFMGNFYDSLNDTAVSALRNYASMYVRDVNTEDSQEKEYIVTVINNISDLAEFKTTKIFIKQTAHFELDENKDENANIKALKDYVKDTIEKTKRNIENNLEIGFKSLKAKLMQSIKKDLSINLGVDLNNLARDLKMRICSDFSSCNGKIVGRRFGYMEPFNKRNNVYVKLQLSFDDEFKKSVGRSKITMFPDISYSKTENSLNRNKHRFVKQTRMFRKLNVDKKDITKDSRFNVTRTTLLSTSTIIQVTKKTNKGVDSSNATVATSKNISLN